MLDRVWRKGNPLTLLVGMQIGAIAMENSMEISQIIRNRINIWSSNLTPEHLSRENHDSQRHMYSNVHGSTIYNSQDMETT